MNDESNSPASVNRVAVTARTSATALASLALAAAICLCLLFGGTAVASGAANAGHHRADHPERVAAMPAEQSAESAVVALEKIAERATERRAQIAHGGADRPVRDERPGRSRNR